MRSFIIVLLFAAALSVQQSAPGIRVAISTAKMNEWLSQHLDVLQYVDLPLPEKEWDFFGFPALKLSNFEIRNVSAQWIQVDTLDQNRIQIGIKKATFTSPFHIQSGLLSATGEVTLQDNSVRVVVSVNSESDGTPIIKVEDMSIEIGRSTLKVKFLRGLRKVLDATIPLIKGWVEKESPKVAKPILNLIIRSVISKYGTVLPVDPQQHLALDVGFFSNPEITSELIAFNIKAEPHVNGERLECPYAYSPPYSGGNDDVKVTVDSNFMNCMTVAAAQSDAIDEFLTEVYKMIPTEQPISVGIQLFGDNSTVLKIKEGGLSSSIHTNILLFRGKEIRDPAYLKLGLTASVKVSLSFEGSDFSSITLHGELGKNTNALSILSFNGDTSGLTTDLSVVAKQLSMLDGFVNHPFVQKVSVPVPEAYAWAQVMMNKLLKMNLQFVNNGFYAGLSYKL